MTLVYCCTSANFQSVCLLLFMFFFFALFFNVLYEPYYFFTSNTSNRNNIGSTIFILATCYLLISFPLQSITFLLALSCLLLFGQMITGNLISLNIRGISNFRKRKTIFTWCRKQKADIVFLQETHSTEKNEA